MWLNIKMPHFHPCVVWTQSVKTYDLGCITKTSTQKDYFKNSKFVQNDARRSEFLSVSVLLLRKGAGGWSGGMFLPGVARGYKPKVQDQMPNLLNSSAGVLQSEFLIYPLSHSLCDSSHCGWFPPGCVPECFQYLLTGRVGCIPWQLIRATSKRWKPFELTVFFVL